MPIYIYLANLIIEKKTVEKKYKGGVAKFRKDYLSRTPTNSQEDDELFSIARMNRDEFEIDNLVDNGLHFDEKTWTSTDFVIILRYGSYLWKLDWIEDNNVFAWHKECNPKLINRANVIAETTFDDIQKAFERGEQLLDTITCETENIIPIHKKVSNGLNKKNSPMNKTQKIIFLVVALVLTAMLIYPPFIVQRANGLKENRGYSFITQPPRDSFTPVIDLSTLCMQFFVVIFLGVALYFFFNESHKPQDG